MREYEPSEDPSRRCLEKLHLRVAERIFTTLTDLAGFSTWIDSTRARLTMVA